MSTSVHKEIGILGITVFAELADLMHSSTYFSPVATYSIPKSFFICDRPLNNKLNHYRLKAGKFETKGGQAA
jgi:hypothetical protein